MQPRVFHDALQFRYELFNASEVDYHLFLNSNTPEEVLLTVLGDFKQEKSDDVLRAIVVRLGQLVPRSLRLKRYIKQTRIRLEILSKLRNLQELTIKISEKMALVYDLETDVRFKQGEARGLELAIVKLLQSGLLNHEQIAETLDVSINHVKAIAQRLTD